MAFHVCLNHLFFTKPPKPTKCEYFCQSRAQSLLFLFFGGVALRSVFSLSLFLLVKYLLSSARFTFHTSTSHFFILFGFFFARTPWSCTLRYCFRFSVRLQPPWSATTTQFKQMIFWPISRSVRQESQTERCWAGHSKQSRPTACTKHSANYSYFVSLVFEE